MKILVIGKSGQLARSLDALKEGRELTFLSRAEADLSFPEKTEEALRSKEFDVLVNAAAYTAVDAAEADREAAEAVNAAAPGVLAQICAKRGALMIHISTDYVYDGSASLPLCEDAPVAPCGVYGVTKAAGEEAVRAACPEHLILRTSWLYNAEGKNFVNTMLRLGETRSSLRVVFDQIGCPTYSADLAEAVYALIDAHAERGAEDFPFGTYHYANEGVASWYDLACAVFEMSGMQREVLPVRSSEFPSPAKRPAYSVTDKAKIKDTFGIKIRHWRIALRDCLAEKKLKST